MPQPKPTLMLKALPCLTFSCTAQAFILTNAKLGMQTMPLTNPGTTSRPSSSNAQAELRLQQQATSTHISFSNYVNNQENYTANLTIAQAADLQAFCQLVTTNSDLAEQL
jgi:hypothetical protein